MYSRLYRYNHLEPLHKRKHSHHNETIPKHHWRLLFEYTDVHIYLSQVTQYNTFRYIICSKSFTYPDN